MQRWAIRRLLRCMFVIDDGTIAGKYHHIRGQTARCCRHSHRFLAFSPAIRSISFVFARYAYLIFCGWRKYASRKYKVGRLFPSRPVQQRPLRPRATSSILRVLQDNEWFQLRRAWYEPGYCITYIPKSINMLPSLTSTLWGGERIWGYMRGWSPHHSRFLDR